MHLECLENRATKEEESCASVDSVRQPYAELIMHKEKNIEHKSKPTKMSERV
jgi:hypothetical protein